MDKQHIDNGGSLVDCAVNDGHYCIYCAQESNKREIDDAYARGLADGLERAAEYVRTAPMPKADDKWIVQRFFADILRDKAAKIREGK